MDGLFGKNTGILWLGLYVTEKQKAKQLEDKISQYESMIRQLENTNSGNIKKLTNDKKIIEDKHDDASRKMKVLQKKLHYIKKRMFKSEPTFNMDEYLKDSETNACQNLIKKYNITKDSITNLTDPDEKDYFIEVCKERLDRGEFDTIIFNVCQNVFQRYGIKLTYSDVSKWLVDNPTHTDKNIVKKCQDTMFKEIVISNYNPDKAVIDTSVKDLYDLFALFRGNKKFEYTDPDFKNFYLHFFIYLLNVQGEKRRKIIYHSSTNIDDSDVQTLLMNSQAFSDTLYSTLMTNSTANPDSVIKCDDPNFGLKVININVSGTAFAYPVAIRYSDPTDPTKEGIFLTKIFMTPVEVEDEEKLKYYQKAFKELNIYNYFNKIFGDPLFSSMYSNKLNVAKGFVNNKECGPRDQIINFKDLKLKYYNVTGLENEKEITYQDFLNNADNFESLFLTYSGMKSYYKKILNFFLTFLNTFTFQLPSDLDKIGTGDSTRYTFKTNVSDQYDVTETISQRSSIINYAKMCSVLHNLIRLNKGSGTPVDLNPQFDPIKNSSEGCKGYCTDRNKMLQYKFELKYFQKKDLSEEITPLIVGDKINSLVEEYALILKEIRILSNIYSTLPSERQKRVNLKFRQTLKEFLLKLLSLIRYHDSNQMTQIDNVHKIIFELTHVNTLKQEFTLSNTLDNILVVRVIFSELKYNDIVGPLGFNQFRFVLSDDFSNFANTNSTNIIDVLYSSNGYTKWLVAGIVATPITDEQERKDKITELYQLFTKSVSQYNDRVLNQNILRSVPDFYDQDYNQFLFLCEDENVGGITILNKYNVIYNVQYDYTNKLKLNKLKMIDEKRIRFSNEKRLIQDKKYMVKFLFMEYFDGISFADFITDTIKFTQIDKINGVLQVLFQMMFLRKLNFKHNDLHIDNVFLSRDPQYDPGKVQYYVYKLHDDVKTTLLEEPMYDKLYFINNTLNNDTAQLLLWENENPDADIKKFIADTRAQYVLDTTPLLHASIIVEHQQLILTILNILKMLYDWIFSYNLSKIPPNKLTKLCMTLFLFIRQFVKIKTFRDVLKIDHSQCHPFHIIIKLISVLTKDANIKNICDKELLKTPYLPPFDKNKVDQIKSSYSTIVQKIFEQAMSDPTIDTVKLVKIFGLENTDKDVAKNTILSFVPFDVSTPDYSMDDLLVMRQRSDFPRKTFPFIKNIIMWGFLCSESIKKNNLDLILYNFANFISVYTDIVYSISHFTKPQSPPIGPIPACFSVNKNLQVNKYFKIPVSQYFVKIFDFDKSIHLKDRVEELKFFSTDHDFLLFLNTVFFKNKSSYDYYATNILLLTRIEEEFVGSSEKLADGTLNYPVGKLAESRVNWSTQVYKRILMSTDEKNIAISNLVEYTFDYFINIYKTIIKPNLIPPILRKIAESGFFRTEAEENNYNDLLIELDQCITNVVEYDNLNKQKFINYFNNEISNINPSDYPFALGILTFIEVALVKIFKSVFKIVTLLHQVPVYSEMFSIVETSEKDLKIYSPVYYKKYDLNTGDITFFLECILASFTYDQNKRTFIKEFRDYIPSESKRRIQNVLTDEQYVPLANDPIQISTNEIFIKFIINIITLITKSSYVSNYHSQPVDSDKTAQKAKKRTNQVELRDCLGHYSKHVKGTNHHKVRVQLNINQYAHKIKVSLPNYSTIVTSDRDKIVDKLIPELDKISSEIIDYIDDYSVDTKLSSADRDDLKQSTINIIDELHGYFTYLKTNSLALDAKFISLLNEVIKNINEIRTKLKITDLAVVNDVNKWDILKGGGPTTDYNLLSDFSSNDVNKQGPETIKNLLTLLLYPDNYFSSFGSHAVYNLNVKRDLIKMFTDTDTDPSCIKAIDLTYKMDTINHLIDSIK